MDFTIGFWDVMVAEYMVVAMLGLWGLSAYALGFRAVHVARQCT